MTWPVASKPRRYRNVPVEIDGMRFDSNAEAKDWFSLKLRERMGEIRNLQRQVPFSIDINGKHICKWIADFVYFEDERRIIADRKSNITRRDPTYRLKKKLVEACYPGVVIIEWGVKDDGPGAA